MLTIASWNVAGTSLLKTPTTKRNDKQQKYNKQLHKLIERCDPDIILLQEVIQYRLPGKKNEYIFDIPEQYFFTMHAAISSQTHCYPPKWNKIKQAGEWPKNTHLSHGIGLLWKKKLGHSSIWNIDNTKSHHSANLSYEVVRLESGLFTGSRNTEPRLALVSHFHHKNIDYYIINVHLTTLSGEREGYIERDKLGSQIRQKQIETIFDGIISRLNHDRDNRLGNKLKHKHPAVWILAGDFNAGIDSPEITKIQQMNFTRLCDNSPTKRAKSSKVASIKVDFIFTGSRYFDVDPMALDQILKQTADNYQVVDDIKISDHHPIVLSLPNHY